MNYIHRHCLHNIDNITNQQGVFKQGPYPTRTPMYFLDISINTDFVLKFKGIKEVQFTNQQKFEVKLKTKYSSKEYMVYPYHRFFKTYLEAVCYFNSIRDFCLKRLSENLEHLQSSVIQMKSINP